MTPKLNPCKCGKLPDYILIRYNDSEYQVLGCVKCRNYNSNIGDQQDENAVYMWNSSTKRLNSSVTFIRYVQKTELSGLALQVKLQEELSCYSNG